MSTVLNKVTMELLASVNTPDYPPESFIINPDLKAVAGIEPKYWKIDKGQVVPMDTAEKTAVDILIEEKEAAGLPVCPYGFTPKCEYYKI